MYRRTVGTMPLNTYGFFKWQWNILSYVTAFFWIHCDIKGGHVFYVIAVLFIAACKPLFGQPADTLSFDQLSIIPLQDLINVKIVSAGKTEKTIRATPASIELITRGEIESYGYQSLKEVLNSIPGYYILGNLGFEIPGVRGYAKGKGVNFVVLLNGLKLSDDNILHYDQIPVSAIERIEVIRGPMAVTYGNQAFFGTLNIVTRSSLKNQSANRIFTSYATHSTQRYSAKIEGNNGGFNATLDIAYNSTQGPELYLADMMTNPKRLNEPLFGGEGYNGLAVPPEKHTTKDLLNRKQYFFNYYATFEGFFVNAMFTEALNKRYYYFPSLNDGSTFKTGDFSSLFGYRNKFNDQLRVESRLQYTNTSSIQEYQLLSNSFFGEDLYTSTAWEAELNLAWQTLVNLNIEIGGQFESLLRHQHREDVPQQGHMNFLYENVAPHNSANTASGFLQIDYQVIKQLRCIGGMRVEQSCAYDLQIERFRGVMLPPGEDSLIQGTRAKGDIEIAPRIAAIYQPNTKNLIKLLYGKALKRPSPEIIGEDMLDIYSGIKSSDYSSPEYINTLEVNYMAQLSRNLRMDLSVYQNSMNNLLVENTRLISPGNLRAYWTNTGEIVTRGGELDIRLTPVQHFLIQMSCAYQETHDESFNIMASFSPNWLAYLKMNYKLGRKVTFSITGNYVDNMLPFYDYAPQLDEAGELTGQSVGRTALETSDYLIMNFNIRTQPALLKGFYLQLHCHNVFDKQYYYPTFSINSFWADKGTLSNGRVISLGVGYTF